MQIPVIFEDNNLLVVDKPPNLVVDSLADILQKDFNIKLFRGGVVHRLDKDTSGIMLIAKTQKALENLQSQFKIRKIKKEYLALVHGRIDEGGVIDAALARNPKNREKFTVWGPGKEAVTEYQPIKLLVMSWEFIEKTFEDFNTIQLRKLRHLNYQLYTLLVARPKTGRTHQIRVHLKYIGRPIVADEKYVGRKMFRLDKRWCPRLFLHAQKLGFYHPLGGKWMEIKSELPADLAQALKKLNG